MKHGLKAFDSDMHVYDHPDLYSKYMNTKWGDRVPVAEGWSKHGRPQFKIGDGAKRSCARYPVADRPQTYRHQERSAMVVPSDAGKVWQHWAGIGKRVHSQNRQGSVKSTASSCLRIQRQFRHPVGV